MIPVDIVQGVAYLWHSKTPNVTGFNLNSKINFGIAILPYKSVATLIK